MAFARTAPLRREIQATLPRRPFRLRFWDGTRTATPEADGVDQKLVVLAQQENGRIMTNDFNLSKVAQLHHVRARLERGRLREHLAHTAKVALNVPLPRTELGYGDVQQRHRPKVRTFDR